MKTILTTAAALAATTTLAGAGGLDRSGQSVGVLFEQGRYAEFSFGSVDPSISGVAVAGLGGFDSGDVSPSYSQFGMAYKADLNDTWSYALIYDQPFGAAVDYATTTPYFAGGATAELKSQALTGVLQYNMPSNVSIFGGLRLQEIEAVANIPFIPGGYDVAGAADMATGYLVGVAYERPDIALRVALTYNSEIEHSLDTVENSGLGAGRTSKTEIVTPQSINLEFQSGVAEDTLVFGSVRWAEWGDFTISPADYSSGALTGGPLVAYNGDYITYSLGVGRRLNDMWSVAATVGYEDGTGGLVNNLGPNDGFVSLGLSAVYTHENVKVTGGVRFVEVGDANTQIPGFAPAGVFSDNTAVAAGVKVGYTF